MSIEILRQVGLATDPLAGPLVAYAAPSIVDPRGDRSGEVRSVFRLA
ncbi:MAG: hypothetical protein H0X68_05260 [Chloroflexi bacterium]|nr:hypothetical protein [Chloroflexota bacterium]